MGTNPGTCFPCSGTKKHDLQYIKAFGKYCSGNTMSLTSKRKTKDTLDILYLEVNLTYSSSVNGLNSAGSSGYCWNK